MPNLNAVVTGVSGFVPEKVMTNQDFEKFLDTNDEWIKTRTGISERRVLEEGKGTSFMAVKAVEELLKKTNTSPEEVDCIICSTVTPDMVFPATANKIADLTGLTNSFGFDIEAACSGFIYALSVGAKYVESGFCKKVIIVGADKMSSLLDYTDRTTCILFGDGAGAVMLEPTESEYGFMDAVFGSDGSGRQFLHQKAGGSLKPPSIETVKNREHDVYQEGKSVVKLAVSKMADSAEEVMKRNNLEAEDIAFLVPHQANKRIIDATANRMGLDSEKVMINIHKYGNTTDGTIPLCLWEWEDQLKKGDNLILAAFGGGFTWGAVYLKWAYN